MDQRAVITLGPASDEELSELRTLHARRRNADLCPEDLARYTAAVERFLTAALSEQNAKLKNGHQRRAAVRLSRSIQVELSWEGGKERSVTSDLGLGGFSAVFATPPPTGVPITAVLRMRRDERITTPVKVTGVRQRRGNARSSFAFAGLSETDGARLKMYIVDELLPRWRSPAAPSPSDASPSPGIPGRAMRHVA
jgi:hypothetical protein